MARFHKHFHFSQIYSNYTRIEFELNENSLITVKYHSYFAIFFCHIFTKSMLKFM